MRKTATTAIHGTQLESDKKRVEEQEKFVTPSMALSRAPKRADVGNYSNLLPDVVREEKEREILCKADWSKNFAKLGLKKEFLQVALDREEEEYSEGRCKGKERGVRGICSNKLHWQREMSRQKGTDRGRQRRRRQETHQEKEGTCTGRRWWSQRLGIINRLLHHRR